MNPLPRSHFLLSAEVGSALSSDIFEIHSLMEPAMWLTMQPAMTFGMAPERNPECNPLHLKMHVHNGKVDYVESALIKISTFVCTLPKSHYRARERRPARQVREKRYQLGDIIKNE